MKTAAIVFLGLAVAAASATASEIPCICTREYMPVCGSDGVTYPNSCAFRCAARADSDLRVVAEGECTHPFEKEVPCICTLEYMPVCGSDGVTYPNTCTFRCKQRANDDLTIVSHGECPQPSLKMARPVCACTREYNPMCGSDGRTYANPCLLRCQMKADDKLALQSAGECPSAKAVAPLCACTREYFPLCGSDGRTYNNPCLLRCQQKVDNGLTAVHQGRCEDAEPTLRKALGPMCPCSREYFPLCGSDGRTYDNLCLLRCQQKTDNSLTAVRRGRCEDIQAVPYKIPAIMCPCTRQYDPVCGNDGETYDNECLLKCQQRVQPGLEMARFGRCKTIPMAQMGRSAPMCLCTREYNPFCGSDGVTYNNECLLKCAQRQQPSLTAVRRGRCQEQQEPKALCACNRMLWPVCGSDGKTYDNPCLLQCEQRQNSGLTQVHEGECDSTVQLKSMKVCPCPLIFRPVCGTDGVTYDNECALNCRAKNENSDLKVFHQGACFMPFAKAGGPCVCDKMYLPVCGTDGVTYNNPCLIGCQQKENSDLTIAHYGRCAQEFTQLKVEHVCACPFIYLPVCGTNGVTYPNECALNCQTKNGNPGLTVAHLGACAEELKKKAEDYCICTDDYRPVCGSDMRTYANKCEFKCAQKNQNGLTISHEGMCQEVPIAEDVCICNRMYLPVCGTDGVTYDNPCMLGCAQKTKPGLTMKHDSEC